MRQRGVEIDRHVELLGALVDRPELLEVEEFPVRHAVQHGALEAELCDSALELVRRGLWVGGGERGKGGKALGVGRANFGEAIVNLRVRSAAMSAPSFWVDGAPCERT